MNASIVIAGSGIAASAVMLYLQKNGFQATQIAPLEKRADKIGETLSCSANRILKELDIWDVFLKQEYLINDQIFTAWESPILRRQSIFSNSDGSNWSIERNDFENFLRLRVDNGHHRRLYNKVQNCRNIPHGIELELDDHQSIETDFLFDCSGRSGIASRRFGRRQRIDNMICFYSFLTQIDTDIEPTVGIMTEAVKNGWWYSAILPDNRMIVSFYTYSDLVTHSISKNLQAWRVLIEKAPLTCQRIESAGYSVLTTPSASDAGMVIQSEVSGEHWIAAGDAVGSLDPLSSHGMTQALWSGCRAAQAYIKSMKGDPSGIVQYRQTLTQAMFAYQTELIQKYRCVDRFADHPFWQRRVSLNFHNQ